jgi:hypothetical protein
MHLCWTEADHNFNNAVVRKYQIRRRVFEGEGWSRAEGGRGRKMVESER